MLSGNVLVFLLVQKLMAVGEKKPVRAPLMAADDGVVPVESARKTVTGLVRLSTPN